MIARELETLLQSAFAQARQQHHEFITVEHLLLALSTQTRVLEVLRACGARVDELREQLSAFIEDNTPLLPPQTGESPVDTQPTLGFQRVLQRALLQKRGSAASQGGNSSNSNAGTLSPIHAEDLLLALFGEKDSHAVYFLHQQGVTRQDVLHTLTHGAPRAPEESVGGEPESERENRKGRDGRETPLQQYALNLNQMASEGRIDPLIGREREIERLVQTLCRRRKNNPLLVGEAGVGKTAIAEGLAWRIVRGNVPEVLSTAVLYSLDLGALLAGAKYRGDFEQRLKGVLKQIQEKPGAVLFIDEIHTLVGAGSASGSALDASNLLKPALNSGQLRCIGATTFSEYRALFEKDAALSRRFQKIDVPEPSAADTLQILKGLSSRFEEHHSVKYSAEALKAAVELSERFMPQKRLPDKAIDILDEAGAAQRVLPASRRRRTITRAEIESVVAKISGVPLANITPGDKDRLQNLERDLRAGVFGQDAALAALANAIKSAHAGLARSDKPIGAFLFTGPTGVGKTEAARQLASVLGIALTRFDMSEYMERHTVSRLIGAPPGYVGFDQGGLLTEAINQKPHTVLLLDEIEKAHPDVFNLLLQVMDSGTLTDNNGRRADFRHVILIMTSNAGAELLSKTAIGFTPSRQQGDEMTEVRRLFSPEFRNRLDAIIPFATLSEAVILRVVDKFLLVLESQLLARNVEVGFSDALRHLLAREGFDPQMGARPMQRLIQDRIRGKLADELLFGRLAQGGRLNVDANASGEILLSIEPPAPTKPAPPAAKKPEKSDALTHQENT